MDKSTETIQRLIFNNTLGEAHPLNQAGLSPEAKCIPNKYYRSLGD